MSIMFFMVGVFSGLIYPKTKIKKTIQLINNSVTTQPLLEVLSVMNTADSCSDGITFGVN